MYSKSTVLKVNQLTSLITIEDEVSFTNKQFLIAFINYSGTLNQVNAWISSYIHIFDTLQWQVAW